VRLTRGRIALAVCAVLFVCLVAFVVFGFYLVKQGAYIIGNGFRAQPIEKLLSSGSLEPGEPDFLLRVLGIREYGEISLGLSKNENYTTYLSLGKKGYLVDVVSACAKTRFEEYVWHYPLFGDFPYKGFFERKDAEDLSRSLRALNLDTIIRKVDAFSTLGFFKDPVYDFMSGYSDYELVSLILHEQTHATVWVKDAVSFNEQLAVFAGREGALRYIADKYGQSSKKYADAVSSTAESEDFASFIRSAYAALHALYESDAPESVKLSARGLVFHAFKERYRLDIIAKTLRKSGVDESPPNTTGDISEYADSSAAFPMNNAFIMLFMGYEEDLAPFYELYESMGRDLRKTIGYIAGVKNTKLRPMEYILQGAKQNPIDTNKKTTQSTQEED
jgi:predicted aminopeptidase